MDGVDEVSSGKYTLESRGERERERLEAREGQEGGGGGMRGLVGWWSFSNFLFSSRGMYLGGKSGTSQGVWSAAEMDHAILLVRCDAHEP